MEPEYDELEYLRDQAILNEELRQRMEAEWQEAEYEEQLPAKIIIIKTPEKHAITNSDI